MHVFKRWVQRQGRADARAPAMLGQAQGDEAAPDPQASYRLGNSLLERGMAGEALATFQRAVVLDSRPVEAHIGQARAYAMLGERQEAVDSLETALALDPESVVALHMAGNLLIEADEQARGIELLARARTLSPEDAEIEIDLARALNRSGRPDEAVGVYREAIARDPSALAARVNLGLIHLQQRGEPQVAEKLFREALAISPEFLPAAANLGLALHDQGRFGEELEVYRQGLERDPRCEELLWNRAIARLSNGDFADGWEDYELRLRRRGGRRLDRFPYPDWNGARIGGELLVLAEQGLGDEVMFASCFKELQGYAEGLVIECAPRLEALFARSFPGAVVHGADRNAALGWLEDRCDVEAKIAIGSVPRWLRRSARSFPRHDGFLRADPARTAAMRARLRDLGPGPTIGVCWRGGTLRTRGELRSMTIEQLGLLARVPGLHFVCMQHGLKSHERDLARGLGVHVWDGIGDDIEQTAALLCALDLYIGVPNTTAHLCGALGCPGWVLLNESPDWRWMNSGETSLWYPSLSLLRRRYGERWEALLQRVATRLAELGAHGRE